MWSRELRAEETAGKPTSSLLCNILTFYARLSFFRASYSQPEPLTCFAVSVTATGPLNTPRILDERRARNHSCVRVHTLAYTTPNTRRGMQIRIS